MNNNVIEDGTVYEANIVDQIVTRNRNDELQVVFTTKVGGKLTNDRDPNGAAESLEPFERDVYVTFSDDQQKLGMAIDHLRRLGFEDSDVVKLHPDHPKFYSMVGKDVRVRCKVKGEATYWNFAWSRSRPLAVKLEDAQTTAVSLKGKIEQLRGKSTDGDDSGGQSTDTRPPVSY